MGILFLVTRCEDPLTIACTEIFKSVIVTAVDATGGPVNGLAVHTVQLTTGDTVHVDPHGLGAGQYVVISDAEKNILPTEGGIFRVSGTDGTRGFATLYTIGTDENRCHVERRAGPDTVVVNP